VNGTLLGVTADVGLGMGLLDEAVGVGDVGLGMGLLGEAVGVGNGDGNSLSLNTK